jgi:FixJ family two-component response regulator
MSLTPAESSKAPATAALLSPREALLLEMYRRNGLASIQPPILRNKNEVLICVVDHDDSLRKDVTRLLQSEKYRIESFTSAQAFLNRKAHDGPCCLVLDVHMRGLGGFNLQEILLKAGRTEQIIFVSGNGDVATCAQAFRAGAVDFLTKPLKNAELLRAVENALIRSERLLLLRNERRVARDMLDQLTPREREVLGFVIAGRINKEIAAELGAGEKTIKKHRGQLMRKLKVGSVAELVHFSMHNGVKPSRPYGTKVPYTSMQ